MTDPDSPVCREWEHERSRHPAKGMTGRNETEFWDSVSRSYSDIRYRRIKENIISELVDRGILEAGKTVIDIGSGTGAFALPVSACVAHIDCMDLSPKMLEAIDSECIRRSVDNITTVLCDWSAYVPDKMYDVAFTSLCPAMNNPSSILKMETCTDGTCVYISSAGSDKTIQCEIWRKLGKDYSYNGNDTKFPFEFLKSIGREPTFDVFSESADTRISAEDAIAYETGIITRYIEMTDDVRKTIEDVIRSHESGGFVSTESEMRLGLLVWDPV